LPDNFSEQANSTIGQLRQLCEKECYNITSDIVCVGRVTSSDRDGNFYRSITIEDESGGVEVKLGIYNIASQYPVGLMVALHLNSTAIMVENGVVQVGLPPQRFDSSPREMEAQEVIDRHIIRSNSIEQVEPLLCDIDDLDLSLCGRFVRVENLSYTPLTEQKTEYYRLTDNEDRVIFLFVSAYSNFANLKMPTTHLLIQGVLYHEAVGEGRQFVIKPRCADDISTNHDSF
jgi:hypothetical protein